MGHEVKQAKWAAEILAYALDTLKKNGVVTKKELCKKVKDANINTRAVKDVYKRLTRYPEVFEDVTNKLFGINYEIAKHLDYLGKRGQIKRDGLLTTEIIETIQRPKKKERLKTKGHCDKVGSSIFSKATTLRGWA